MIIRIQVKHQSRSTIHLEAKVLFLFFDHYLFHIFIYLILFQIQDINSDISLILFYNIFQFLLNFTHYFLTIFYSIF
jgi:hypothetical protein